jgi:branched-chain amino acid aminotransferase
VLEAYVDGQFVLSDRASVSIFDRGFLRGDGVFDTWRTYDGRTVTTIVQRHLARLEASIRYIELDPAPIVAEVAAASDELVDRNRDEIRELGDVWVAVVVTRGRYGSAIPTRVVLLRPFPIVPGLHHDGAHLTASLAGAGPFGSVDPRVKSISRLGYSRAEHSATRLGAGRFGVLLNPQGFITEVTGANLVLVRDQVVLTPPAWDVLPGISMGLFNEFAHKLGFQTAVQPLTMYDVLNCDGAYLTATSFGMAPVREVDGIPLKRETNIGPRVLESWIDYVGFDFVAQADAIARTDAHV